MCGCMQFSCYVLGHCRYQLSKYLEEEMEWAYISRQSFCESIEENLFVCGS